MALATTTRWRRRAAAGRRRQISGGTGRALLLRWLQSCGVAKHEGVLLA